MVEPPCGGAGACSSASADPAASLEAASSTAGCLCGGGFGVESLKKYKISIYCIINSYVIRYYGNKRSAAEMTVR